MQTIVLTIHIILALSITILVLMQRSEGGALGSLGGGQASASLFTGRQAGNLLSRLTTYFFICFIVTSVTLVLMAKQEVQIEKITLLPSAQTSDAMPQE